MSVVAHRQRLIGDVDGDPGGRERPKVSGDVPFLLPVGAPLKRGKSKPTRLRRATDEDHIMILEFKTPLVIRKLEPAFKIFTHVVDDASL